MLKISDRYVLVELLKPFLAGVIAFMIIMISNTLYIFMELIVKSSIDTVTVIKMLLYSLPAIIVVTLPVAYMFATLLALGRLGRDSEIIALRACGVSLSRIIMPVIVLSILISGLGFWIQERVVPWANTQTVEILKNMMQREPLKAIKAKVFLNADGRNFYVNEVDREKETLKQVYVLDQTKSLYPQIIAAEEAKRQQTRWLLNNGILRKMEESGYLDHEIRFEKMEIQMEVKPEMVFNNQPSVRELASGDASKLIAEKKQQGIDTRADEMDLHTKFSLPLATFFTILLAAPIGIMFSKMGNYFGVAISIALVFVWYVTYSIFTSLGKAGTVHPVLAAWVQNIAFGGVGTLLLLQLSGVKFKNLLPTLSRGSFRLRKSDTTSDNVDDMIQIRKTRQRRISQRPAHHSLRTLLAEARDSHGRLSRREYLAASCLLGLAQLLVLGLLGVGFVLIMRSALVSLPFETLSWAVEIFAAVLAVYGLFCSWQHFSLAIKRLHDFKASGGWSLTLLLPGVQLITVLVLMFKRGQQAPNPYGEPLAETNVSDRLLALILITVIVLMTAAFVGVLLLVSGGYLNEYLDPQVLQNLLQQLVQGLQQRVSGLFQSLTAPSPAPSQAPVQPDFASPVPTPLQTPLASNWSTTLPYSPSPTP